MTGKNKTLLAPKQNEQQDKLIINQQSDNMLVDARLLHQRLGVKHRFNDWIKNRIKDYGLVEVTDYISLTKNLVSGGKEKCIYLTLDTAKELAMVEKTDEGRNIRRYFIEAEKELRGKRLYGQKLNLTEIRKQVFSAKINGHVMLAAREARGLLGYNTRGSLCYWRNKFPGLIINYNDRLVASEEIIELWMLKATLTGKSAYAKTLSETKPVLGHNFGQLPLNLK